MTASFYLPKSTGGFAVQKVDFSKVDPKKTNIHQLCKDWQNDLKAHHFVLEGGKSKTK